MTPEAMAVIYVLGFFFWFFICGLTNIWGIENAPQNSREYFPCREVALIVGALFWPISWLILLTAAIFKLGIIIKNHHQSERTYSGD